MRLIAAQRFLIPFKWIAETFAPRWTCKQSKIICNKKNFDFFRVCILVTVFTAPWNYVICNLKLLSNDFFKCCHRDIVDIWIDLECPIWLIIHWMTQKKLLIQLFSCIVFFCGCRRYASQPHSAMTKTRFWNVKIAIIHRESHTKWRNREILHVGYVYMLMASTIYSIKDMRDNWCR